VLAATTGGAHWCPHHEGDLALTAGHVTHLGGVIDDLIYRQEEEISVLHVNDGAHAHQRRAHTNTEEPEFGDWRVTPEKEPLYQVLAEHLQTFLERTRSSDR
jgi:hypothetical protein